VALEFEWDPAKAVENLSKHAVSFGEAQGVFADPLALEMPDPDHSQDEERWVVIGRSYRERLLVVAFTEREATIRIISARLATGAEVRAHEEG
jgi:uncharacterized DUF497 family protein